MNHRHLYIISITLALGLMTTDGWSRGYGDFNNPGYDHSSPWIEDVFRQNGHYTGRAFEQRHLLSDIARTAVGLVLLPFQGRSDWRNQHRKNFSRFNEQPLFYGDDGDKFFHLQRLLHFGNADGFGFGNSDSFFNLQRQIHFEKQQQEMSEKQ